MKDNINWEQLKEQYSLEDFYNILCRNEPQRKCKSHAIWDDIESMVYEELLDENENPNRCALLIDMIINFLQIQRKEITF